jgi:hypothetical protein
MSNSIPSRPEAGLTQGPTMLVGELVPDDLRDYFMREEGQSMLIIDFLRDQREDGIRETPPELNGFPQDVSSIIIGIGVSGNPAVVEGMIPSLSREGAQFINLGLRPLLDVTPMGAFNEA